MPMSSYILSSRIDIVSYVHYKHLESIFRFPPVLSIEGRLIMIMNEAVSHDYTKMSEKSTCTCIVRQTLSSHV
jgi:hypothetical protein